MKKNKKKNFNEIERYRKTIAYLFALCHEPKKHGPRIKKQRCAALLQRIGNPHHQLRFIHVAGTSGKGSVATMIQSILVAAGIKAGQLTSPHTVAVIDRIKVDNHFIDPNVFCDLVAKLKPHITYLQQSSLGRPTYHEIIMAIGFLYFVQEHCDIVIIEAFVGGRTDTTNCIPAPLVAVITAIGLDHQKMLGNSITSITNHKAGIIKKGSPVCTTSANPDHVIKLLTVAAAKQRSTLTIAQPQRPYQLQLLGNHQQENAALAVATVAEIGITNIAVLRRGLRNAFIPCRSEVMQKKPLVIIDGAHNEQKIVALTKQINNLTYHTLYLIIGLTKSRRPQKLFRSLLPHADYVFTTQYREHPFKKPYSAERLAKAIKTSAPVRAFENHHDAVQAVLAMAHPNDLILITGSLYLAGEIRQYWRSETDILIDCKS